MSTAVEQPISTLPIAEPVQSQEAAATAAIIEGPGPVVPTKDENAPNAEEKTTTTIKETEVNKPTSPKEGRKPFAVLNNLFARKDKASTPVEAKEPVKEETPGVQEPVKEPVVEQPAVEAVAEPTTEAPAAVPESPKRKDGFLDKLKHLVASEKKEKSQKKSSKEPEETKTEDVAPHIEAPAPTEPLSAVDAPVEPVAAAIPLPAAVAEVPASAPVAAEEPAKEEAPVAAPATEEAKDDKKKAKIGRRLSARIGGLFTSPRKEKSNPMDKSPAEEKTAEESQAPAPAAEAAKVDEIVGTTQVEPLAPTEQPADLAKAEEPKEVKPVEEQPATTVSASVVEEPKPAVPASTEEAERVPAMA